MKNNRDGKLVVSPNFHQVHATPQQTGQATRKQWVVSFSGAQEQRRHRFWGWGWGWLAKSMGKVSMGIYFYFK